MNSRILTALLLAAATSLLGPAACNRIDAVFGGRGEALGIDAAAMDPAVKPGDDFYAYANGKWMKATEIPEDRSNIGGFYIADRETEARIGKQVDAIVKSDPAPGSDAARIKAFYTAYMDRTGIDAAGMRPVQADLARFAAISDVSALSRVLGEQLRADVDPLNATHFATENLFGVFVTQALAGGAVVPYLLQGGIGMPEREYYLSADAKMAGLRGKYRSYIVEVLTAAGIDDAPAKANRIFALESKIAAAHATAVSAASAGRHTSRFGIRRSDSVCSIG